MTPTSQDGWPGDYSYVKIDTRPDSVTGPGSALRKSSSLTPCTATQRVRIKLKRLTRHRKITKVKVFVDRKRVLTRTGRSLKKVSLPGLTGNRRHTVRVYEYSHHKLAKRITRRVRGCA